MLVKLGVSQSNLYLEDSISVTLERIPGGPGEPDNININYFFR